MKLIAITPTMNRSKRIAALWLVFAIVQNVWATDISVSVDRNPVSMNESFKIYFDASDAPDGDPDFTPLETDFTVLNQGQSSNSSWINGQYSKSIRWTVEAMAKQPGNLMIPSIYFGNDRSKPLGINVAKTAADDSAADGTNQDLFLQVKAAPENPFVQSQVLYTVKLYRRVDIAQASLSEPELAEAVVEKLGEDSNYNTVLNGVAYTVTERKYAIFPQKSGKLSIPSLTLNAQVVIDNPRSFGDFFGSQLTKTKRVHSDEILLNVKPAPPAFTGKNWLPAEKLELAQTWSGDPAQVKAGEPITRTLTLRGIGISVGQLPELNKAVNDAGLKNYPDKPVLNEQKTAEGIAATRQEKIALIPSANGKISLPAIEIPWFNTKTERMEMARIPETVLNVTGGNPQSSTAPTPASVSSPAKLAQQSAPGMSEPGQTAIAKPNSAPQSGIWPWVSLALAIGWMATLVYFLGFRGTSKKGNTEDPKQQVREIRLQDIKRQLKQACQNNDSAGAKAALLSWGKQQFDVANLGALANVCADELKAEILRLNRHLYCKTVNEWEGGGLLRAFNNNNPGKNQEKTDTSELAPLHRF